MASLIRSLAIVRNLVATVGIFLGFYFLFSGNPPLGVSLVAVLAVGVVGLIAFLSHVVLHREDAARLGWEVGAPYFQYEVGFANLAFAIAALIAVAASFGPRAGETVIIGYAVYLLQAGLLHARLSAEAGNGERRGRAVLSLVFALAMFGFVWAAFLTA